MDRNLEAILSNTKCPDEFKTFLKENEVHLVWDLALMAATEDKVEEKIILPARIANIRTKHRIAITKAWALARAQYDKEKDIRAGRGQQEIEAPLDDPTLNELQKTWHEGTISSWVPTGYWSHP